MTSKNRQKLKNANLTLLLFLPLYFFLDRVNKSQHLIPLTYVLKILSICLLISLILLFFLTRKLSRDKSIFIIAFSLFIYLFFRPILDTITILKPLQLLRKSYFYLPFFTLIFFLMLFLTHKAKALGKTIIYLNVLFFVLLFVEIGEFFFITGNENRYKLITDKIETVPVTEVRRPNIYLLVLDEYTGLKSINDYFNFSNTAFVDSLKKRDFFVAQNPNSNYNLTWISMLSTLELSYIKNYNKEEFANANIYGNAAEQIKENNLITFLNNLNYDIINNTFFEFNHAHSSVPLLRPLKERLLLNKTLGYALKRGLLNHIPSNKVQLLLNSQFAEIYRYNQLVIEQTIQTIKKNNAPVFLYSHFLMPHVPYLKDKDGNTRNFSDTYKELRNSGYPQSYINYLIYTNKLMLQFTDSILQKKNDAIIIIMSDHGYRWQKGKRTVINDFNNFLAVYSTTKNYSLFSDTTSTVNLFRIVLNNYFNQRLPLLNNERIDISKGHL